jgi:hypothetical protein
MHRLEGCSRIVARLKAEGNLRDDVDPAEAADLLWTVTSLRVWEDLVLERSWTPAQYQKIVTRLLTETLTCNRRTNSGKAKRGFPDYPPK